MPQIDQQSMARAIGVAETIAVFGLFAALLFTLVVMVL